MSDDFQQECLDAHNMYRARHGASELRISKDLVKSAQDWAEELLKKKQLENSSTSNRGEVGENISARNSTAKVVDISGQEVSQQWYADSEKYNYDNAEGDAGNFTQMVWLGSQEVGFGKASKEGRCIVVAHYKPPGNVRGRYRDNVKPVVSGGSTKRSSSSTGAPPTPKTTVVTETITTPTGESYTVRREITEFKDEDGNIRKQVKEMRLDDDPGQSGAAAQQSSDSEDDVASGGADSPAKKTPGKKSKEQSTFIKELISTHNAYRKKHGVKALKRNKDLDTIAQKWAEHLTEQSALSNSNNTHKGERLGENIASRWSNGPCDYTGKEVSDHWYSEEKKFTYEEEPTNVQGIGNFTQMIWGNSKEIGVGKARATQEDGSTRVIVVCHYHPAGNMLHCFKENVKKPSK